MKRDDQRPVCDVAVCGELQLLAVESASTYETSYTMLLQTRMENTLRSEGFPNDFGWKPLYEILVQEGQFLIRFLDDQSARWFQQYQKREIRKARKRHA